MRIAAGIDAREARGERFKSCHAAAAPRAQAAEEAGPLFAELASWLAAERVEPLQEKIYGTLAVRERVMKAREREYSLRGLEAWPATYLEGRPAQGGEFAGAQVWGVSGRERRPLVRTVPCPGGAARLWEAPGWRLLHVPGLAGAGALAGSPPAAQAEGMFRAALEAGRGHGFSYRQAARTWIYLARILDWYPEFNRVRSSLYARPEFLAGDTGLLPASTGIQGRAGPHECLMDALFFDPGRGASLRRIQRTSRQEPSLAYGSAFSRGASIEADGLRTVLVSGTASIAPSGASLHAGDARNQALATLGAVRAVLETEGAGLEDVACATVFCKDEAAWAAWRRAMAEARAPEFPAVAVIADVCRPELLVEMEAVAVRRAP